MKPFWPINQFLETEDAEGVAIAYDLRRLLRNKAIGDESIIHLIDELRAKTHTPFLQTKILLNIFDPNRPQAE